MKARRLILSKDEITRRKHQNIVWFGSYGYEVTNSSYSMILYRANDVTPLYVSENLFVSEDLLIQGSNSTWYDYFYLNLYFKKTQEEQFITITTTNTKRFSWLIQFNVFDNNENFIVQKLGLGLEEVKISIDELIDEFGHYSIISNFMIAIMQESETAPSEVFQIEYPTRKSKLIYSQKDSYTYKETQEFNYSSGAESVKDGLIPRLSVIKGELWYKPSYGLPLMEKIKSKGIYDSIIVNYIIDYPDVINLEEFESSLDGHKYIYNSIINTIYNETINLSNNQ